MGETRAEEPRAGDGPVGLSELAARPVRVVVHDPAPTRAFAWLAALPQEELTERSLFRAVPRRDAFSAEHAGLVRALQRAGVEVIRLVDLLGDGELWPLVERNPNQVYTRDGAFTLPWLPGWYVRGSMRKPIRRHEPEVMAAALSALGLRELLAVPAGCFLEGGDVIPLVREGRRCLLVGVGSRTSREGVDALCERLLPAELDEVVAVRLSDRRMNLDGVLVPVADDAVLVHRASIEGGVLLDRHGERAVDVLRLLGDAGMRVVDVTEHESMRLQACNCVCLGERRLVCYDLAPRVLDALAEHAVDVDAIPAGELIKGTGGPRCMTRPLYS